MLILEFVVAFVYDQGILYHSGSIARVLSSASSINSLDYHLET